MATWGEFIAEVPIVNKRSEGIFVKADHVLDLWEERNNLRAELAKLRGGGGVEEAVVPASPIAEEDGTAATRERERCAAEIEEFAQTCPVDPAWRDFTVQLLRTAAQMLREKLNETASEDDADFLTRVVIPPASEEPPLAEPVAEETPPLAEPVAEDHSSLTS